MSFEISDVSKTEKNVKFTIDKSEVLKNYSEIVKLFQKDADLKGFRKGKVPINVVESIYSEQINEELKTRLINVHLRGLAVEQKINIVTTKDLEHEDILIIVDSSIENKEELYTKLELICSKMFLIHLGDETFAYDLSMVYNKFNYVWRTFCSNKYFNNKKVSFIKFLIKCNQLLYF